MPVEFTCPECHRGYSVKDELAGKTAKCGKCGHRMRIPQLAPAPAVSKAPAPKKAPVQAGSVKSPTPKSTQSSMSSWLDDELELAQPAVPAAPKPKTTERTCPACGAALGGGAVLCVACGYDTRTRTKLQTQHVDLGAPSAKPAKRTKIGSAASLLRGTIFSFIGAMLGAIIWAVFAYLTMLESSYIAWGLGGLAGLGMALGHDDDDGTFAGIIAAFMSLVGIIAAKILIIVIIIAAFVGEVAGEADPVEAKRMLLAPNVAGEKLKSKGIEPDEATDEQWEQAQAEAETELAKLSDEELDARIEALIQAEEDEEAAGDDVEVANAPNDAQGGAANQAEFEETADDLAADDHPGAVAMFFKLMFSPIDGIFILLAFFTAYGVGSGQMTD
jgi:predicted Zn finger-like uncharacterized protein